MDIKMIFLEVKLNEEIWLAFWAALRRDTPARKIVVDINSLAGVVL